ncbi:MAG: FecR family protein [Oscillospiraceae bacterium]|jgi:hypothetical protein|nr:FecR family protein [Oscillospiraceae bacterium]
MRTAKILTLALALVMALALAACSGASPSPSPSRSRSPSPSPSPSQVVDTARAAAVEDTGGDVTAETGGEVMSAFPGLALQRDDAIATREQSWTSLELGEGQYILIEENTELRIGNWAIAEGKAWFNVNTPLEVATPNASLSVRGTVFYIAHAGGVTRIAVFEGTVSAGDGYDVTGQALEIDAIGGKTYYELTDDDYRSEYFSERLRDWPGLSGEPGGQPQQPPTNQREEMAFHFSETREGVLFGVFVWLNPSSSDPTKTGIVINEYYDDPSFGKMFEYYSTADAAYGDNMSFSVPRIDMGDVMWNENGTGTLPASDGTIYLTVTGGSALTYNAVYNNGGSETYVLSRITKTEEAALFDSE